MRVTDTTLANQLSGDLESQQATITSLDEELSSGQALTKPSDNPVAAADTLGYSARSRRPPPTRATPRPPKHGWA